MSNRQVVVLSACVFFCIAAIVSLAIAAPAADKGTASNSSATKSASSNSSSSKSSSKSQSLKVVGDDPASIAKMDAQYKKECAQKLKRYDEIYPAAQADIEGGRFADAEKKLKEAFKLADYCSKGEQKLLAQTRLGDCYLKQKKFKEAEANYKKSYDENVELFRGNYPVIFDSAKGLSEVYKASGRTKEAAQILADAKSVRSTRYSVVAIDNADLFAANYESLRSALSKNDSAAVSKLIEYPLSVAWNGDKRKKVVRTFSNEQQFIAAYKKIFTPKILELFAETPERDLWCKDDGIMLGGGHLWLTSVQLGKSGGKPAYKVHSMIVNGDAP